MTEQQPTSGTGTRVLTALVLIPAVVAIVWWGPTWLIAICVGVVILLALHEFFQIGEKAGLRGFPKWTMFCSLLLAFGQWDMERYSGDWPHIRLSQDNSVELVLLVFYIGLGVLVATTRREVKEALPALALTSAGVLLVALPLSYLIKLRGSEPNAGSLLLVLVLVWSGDTTAYFVGRQFAKHPLAPKISPKKTWEGAIGNLLGSVLVAGLLGWSLKWLHEGSFSIILHFVAVGALVSVAGQIGDLVESAYKRSAGVKDSGTLLPGHGGVLDRIDALIFAAPAVWAYLSYVAR